PAPLASVLSQEDERENARQYQRDAEAYIAPQLPTADWARVSDAIAAHVGDPRNFANAPRVLHADLSAEHVLWDGRHVTGILDWGDVCLGDPDYDFSYLYQDFGEDFVREMALEYGHQDPDRLVSKSRYFTIVDQIGTIVHGAAEALPGD